MPIFLRSIPSVLGVCLFPVIVLLVNLSFIKQKGLSVMNTVFMAILFCILQQLGKAAADVTLQEIFWQQPLHSAPLETQYREYTAKKFL